MTPTTQLRILRTTHLRAYSTTTTKYAALCAPTRLAFPTGPRRVQQQQPCLLLQPRAFTTTHFRLARNDDEVARLKVELQQVGDELNSSTSTTSPSPFPAAANPPATTRPAPLDLPARKPDTSTASHLFATGKAYLGFYKTGLKNIYLNWRLARSLKLDSSPAADSPNAPAATTRSALLLRRRVRHDVRRLAPFALLLLVCGELTPLVVLAVPRLVPFTCRIPRQVDALRQQSEARRRASWARLQQQQQQSQGGQITSPPTPPTRDQALAHLARALGLVSPLWDRLLPASLDALVARAARARARAYLALLAEDDALLRRAGGAAALEPDEVALACEDRGVSVSAVGDGGGGGGGGAAAADEKEKDEAEVVEELRERLARALYLTEPWRPRDASALGAQAGEEGEETDLLGTPEMVACALVSGGWGAGTQQEREAMRSKAEEYCRAWGGRLV